MANGPNKTVWAARNRKTATVKEEVRRNEADAEEIAKEWRASGEFKTVRVTRFKVGARPSARNGFKQEFNYAIRAYV